MNLCDVRTIKQIMGMYGLHFKKEFGQNFLTENFVVEDIADNCCDDRNATILEIGPGLGTLTRELAARYKKVICLEIDTGMIPVLQYTLADFDNVTVYNQDVMQADLDELLADAFASGTVAVCANLPYYITTPIMMKLLESGLPFTDITVMIQAEVADRLCAKAGSKDYGAITAVLAYYGTTQKLFKVKAGCFMPAPKVDSTVIRTRLYKEKPYNPKDVALLFRTIKAAFEQRRKTLPNALASGFGELDKQTLTDIIVSCGHSADVRGERLSIEDFVALSDAIYDQIHA